MSSILSLPPESTPAVVMHGSGRCIGRSYYSNAPVMLTSCVSSDHSAERGPQKSAHLNSKTNQPPFFSFFWRQRVLHAIFGFAFAEDFTLATLRRNIFHHAPQRSPCPRKFGCYSAVHFENFRGSLSNRRMCYYTEGLMDRIDCP